ITTTSGTQAGSAWTHARARAGHGASSRVARAAGRRPRAPSSAMAPAPRSWLSPPTLLLLLLLLLSLALLGVRAEPAAGSAVPAQSRPCVDCHAFEFMQRALQDLRKTAYSLDARTETLLLQAERRALCACWPAGR
uniref:NELL2-interacting cell ontogeny regulator 1 n=1 Tax=Cricetulus griseus TaxID=10029 RepID=A0A8C2MQ33_CRIGR